MLVFPYFGFSWACAKSRCSRALGERRSFPTAFTCTAFSCSSAWRGCAAALGWTLPYWGLQVVSIALTIACAYLSAKLIEEPCMRLSKRLLARIPARGERATTH